jgi:hypothetical protein
MEFETMRERTFNMRLTEEEWTIFEATARYLSLPVSSMVRMLVKREHDSIARLMADPRVADQKEAAISAIRLSYAPKPAYKRKYHDPSMQPTKRTYQTKPTKK